jgi:hypothetical protein
MSAPRAIRSALALSSDAEKAAILDEFVVADHELEDRAERAARFRPAQVETGEVASAVTAALLALDPVPAAARSIPASRFCSPSKARGGWRFRRRHRIGASRSGARSSRCWCPRAGLKLHD